MHSVITFVWKIVARNSPGLVMQILLMVVMAPITNHIRSKWRSCTTVTNAGHIVIEKPKVLVVTGAAGAGLAACLACLIAWLVVYNYQADVATNVVGVLIVSLFTAMAILLIVLSRPDKVEIDPGAGKYRHYKGWLGTVNTGNTIDMVGNTVMDIPSRDYADCTLVWASGRSKIMGKWANLSDARQKAMDLAGLLQRAVGAPITIQDSGTRRSNRRPSP